MKLPSFDKKVAISTYVVDGVIYNASPAHGNLLELRKADFGEDSQGVYAEGTYGDEFNLYRGAICRPKRPGAKEVIKLFTEEWVSGDTTVYGGDEGSELIFAQDHPLISRGRIVMNQKRLESCLGRGSRQVGEVIFGSHGVRAIPRKSVRNGSYNPTKIKKSGCTVFLTGREQAPEETAQVLRKIRKPAVLLMPSIGRTIVPGLFEGSYGLAIGGGDRLDVDGDWSDKGGDYCAFGVIQ